jgi:two-component system cell cycle sensor histidine kinase PleC
MVISPLLNYKVKPMLMKVMIGQKMAKLMTNDLLDHHSIERKVFTPKMENCNLFSIVKEVLFLMSDEAKNKDITIVEDMSDSMKLECIADSQRIQQVLINIFQNAIKFSNRNTQITLQANISSTRKAANIQNQSLIETKDTLKVKIIDNGPGITD